MSDTTLNQFVASGTNAERLAYTPSPPTVAAGPDSGYFFYETDTGDTYSWDGSAWQLVGSGGGSGTVTNTGTLTADALIIGNGGVDVKVTTTGANVLTFLGTPSSANLAAALTDETGSGAAVFATSPTLVTPALGTPSSGTLTNCTGYPASALATWSSIYINLQDQKAQNTDGGTFTSGAWQTRVLNTEVSDVGGLCSLASNQFTLSAGTYLISASAPAFACNQNQTRLQNVTDTATLLTGTNAYSDSATAGATSYSTVRGLFTIAAGKALELQHQCAATKTTNGFGPKNNFTTEVYALVELWKIG